VELLEKLGVTDAIVFGWSLGGHIGIEMVPRFSGMRSLMLPAPHPSVATTWRKASGPHMESQVSRTCPRLTSELSSKRSSVCRRSPSFVTSWRVPTVGSLRQSIASIPSPIKPGFEPEPWPHQIRIDRATIMPFK
jgi:hypothetical protein